MRKSLAALLFGALVLPISVTSVQTASAATKCPGAAKSYKCQGSVVVPASGTFRVQLATATTKVTLKGVASRFAFGTQIFLGRVTMRNVPRHGQAFKVFAGKRMPTLHLTSKGTLYAFNPARNSWRTVKAVTSSGIYAAVLG
jgi:hypothetical protein